MVVRVHLRLGEAVSRRLARLRELALATGALLTPAALMALVLGCWRLASDLNLTGEFVISRGLFSHWQVWMVLAGILQTCASLLNRYGRGGREAMP